jgi:hypothetical protein
MNAVEIEEAVSALAERPFNAAEFPFAFLEAFGNKATTIKRLRAGASNRSDVGGVLQTNHIHIAVAEPGTVTATLARLKASPATTKAKAQFVLTTDGDTFETEDVASGETVACDYTAFPDHFGFFLPLAGITTVKQLRESSFDIRATSRLNRLYRTLLEENPDWDADERRADMNHFMARLIFCFFAEDTDIFNGSGLFTATIERMSERNSANTHEVIGEIFRAMNVPTKHQGQLDNRYRQETGVRLWANVFPYVNGGLFSGSLDVPRFSRIARSYLLQIGGLDWTKINPDIFGSMIQAVADDEERGALGMHYTSVPNILKVLNPLFLDDLRETLADAGDNARKLLNLRNRMARIRVFDPACGSGNFLVIAYKQMREIEAAINRRRGEPERASDIPLTNFRGIELRDFPAEVARLALIIAEYQADVLYRGQKLALAEFLPLDQENWITCGNALRLDWLSICPPTGTGVKHRSDDLFHTPLDQAQIDFENEGGETYICGNPPYLGARDQREDQKSDLHALFASKTRNCKSLDYFSGWLIKATDFGTMSRSAAAFVATNSVCQGIQVSILWPMILDSGYKIFFAHPSFRWTNLASYNAGVTVVIIGISSMPRNPCHLFSLDGMGRTIERQCAHINPYITAGEDVIIEKAGRSGSNQSGMTFGNTPIDGGELLLSRDELSTLGLTPEQKTIFVRRIVGSAEFIRGLVRYCLWIEDEHLVEALSIPTIAKRIRAVREQRLLGGTTAQDITEKSHHFQRMNTGRSHAIIVAAISSENRPFLPCGVIDSRTVTTNKNYALYDAPLWNMALIASRLHCVWIGAVCIRMRTDFSYSNTLGWNTFPVPTLTGKMKADLTRCAEDILLTREAHFPATLADLYDPDAMPDDLRAAHERNDEVLERIYIGRRFRNDTERLEKRFELYTKMTAGAGAVNSARKAKA